MRIASLRGSRIDAQKDGTYKVAYRGRELKSDSMLKAEKEAAKAAAKKHRGKPDEGKAA